MTVIVNEYIIALERTTGGKFQNLISDLNKYAGLVNDLEAQFGQLGMVSRIEKLLERSVAKRLGWNVRIISEIDKDYIRNISISTIVPTLILSRKFTTDFIKAIKQGDCKNILLKLKNDLKAKAQEVVREGNDPFEESMIKQNYIVIEASTAGGCFHAALPVNALSLVDTDDADKAYVAKETKKNHFILKPTKEQMKTAIIKALYNKGLSEEQLNKYLKIAMLGNYKIIKEHIQENINKNYKILGNKIIVSSIYNKGE